MGKLEGKVAIVTGSDSGIGKAIAEAFGDEGAIVIITYNSDKDGADETAKQMHANGIKTQVYHLNVADEKVFQMYLTRCTKSMAALISL